MKFDVVVAEDTSADDNINIEKSQYLNACFVSSNPIEQTRKVSNTK